MLPSVQVRLCFPFPLILFSHFLSPYSLSYFLIIIIIIIIIVIIIINNDIIFIIFDEDCALIYVNHFSVHLLSTIVLFCA